MAARHGAALRRGDFHHEGADVARAAGGAPLAAVLGQGAVPVGVGCGSGRHRRYSSRLAQRHRHGRQARRPGLPRRPRGPLRGAGDVSDRRRGTPAAAVALPAPYRVCWRCEDGASQGEGRQWPVMNPVCSGITTAEERAVCDERFQIER